MAKIIYEALQKPLDTRLIEAACIYYEVEQEFFRIKKKDGNTDKRHILFYLLRREANIDLGVIGTKFGYTKQSIQEACERIDSIKNIYLTISREIQRIIEIAAKLEAKLIIVDIELSTLIAK